MDSLQAIKYSRFWNLFLFGLTACLLSTDLTHGRLSVDLLAAPLITIFLISWLTSYIHKYLRTVIQIVIGEFIIGICLIDCYCQIFLGAALNAQIFPNIILTDLREAYEFMHAFIGYRVILSPRIACLIIIALLFPLSYCIGTSLMEKYANKLLVHIIVIFLITACLIIEIPSAYKYIQLFSASTDFRRTEGLIFRHYHDEMSTPLHRFLFSYYASKQSEQLLKRVKQSTYSANIISCSHLSPHIVLVIGESYNKHHSSLYGYRLPTATLQQKRKEKGDLFLFTDVVTAWNITSNVFFDIFSMWESGANDNISDYPLFPVLFRRAGYDVAFFSNQYNLRGFSKGVANQAGHFFLDDKEFSDSIFTHRSKGTTNYDLEMVKQIKAYKRDIGQSAYTLDIVHLIGQHFTYSKRYPHSQASFSIDNYSERPLDKEAKQVVMHYDNATKYNDIVLDSLISIYEKEEVVILFVADHGEEVYDELPIHGRQFNEPTVIQAKNEFEVPMWIWCSELYQSKHPEIVSAINASTRKPILTDGLSQALLFLSGIKCKWTNERNNFLSPHFRFKPRIIGGSVDYDGSLSSDNIARVVSEGLTP